jgi:C_GCAxxG_C_C family probable redox protein
MNTKAEHAAQRADELHTSGFCCSESVLMAVADELGIQSDLIPRIATGLCGGVSRTGDICGAVSGGVLAIGLATGRRKPSDPREENHAQVRRFVAACREKFGSTNCEKLLGCRLDTPEGQQFYKDNKLRERCAFFTREGARLAVATLMEGS